MTPEGQADWESAPEEGDDEETTHEDEDSGE
jgi:hypothetical protein